ncbi:MAG: hypothetical protein LBD04_09045 [Synergistaceae bacterium]|nr:hypothetical protein [Synergistaceae bacterium]
MADFFHVSGLLPRVFDTFLQIFDTKNLLGLLAGARAREFGAHFLNFQFNFWPVDSIPGKGRFIFFIACLRLHWFYVALFGAGRY